MDKGNKPSNNRIAGLFAFAAALLMSVGVCLFPYAKNGIPGHIVDLIYWLERIEGLKDAIVNGDLFPSVYPRFFEGYGYASPLFYSDFFLFPAALLRIAGFSATQSFKLFIAFVVASGFTVSFFSYKKISGDLFTALTGSVLTTTSIYYIWEIVTRAGVGSYIASVFAPLLVLAIWDFFKGGKRTYLFTIAFMGMLLSHVLSAVIALCCTVIVFAIAFCIPKYRKTIFNVRSVKRLATYALITVGISAFYVFPMIEQMRSGHFYYEKPLVNIGDHVVPFSSLFELRAYSDGYIPHIGPGAALWAAVIAAAVLVVKQAVPTVKEEASKRKIPAAVLITGVVSAILITDVFPWKIFNHTPLNSLQFSFRLFPVALCLIVTGFVMLLSHEDKRTRIVLCTVLAVLSLSFAINENRMTEASEASLSFGDEFLSTEGTYYVGMGTEWLPVETDMNSLGGHEIKVSSSLLSENSVTSGIEFVKEGYLKYGFEATDGGNAAYTLPLIYYKGYTAKITDPDGVYVSAGGDGSAGSNGSAGGDGSEGFGARKLNVKKGPNGLLCVENPEMLTGYVSVEYKATTLKKISVVISVIATLLFAVLNLRLNRDDH